MFKQGAIVKQSDIVVEIESVVDCEALGGSEYAGWYDIKGIRLKADLTPDRRKWSQRENLLHTPDHPVEILNPA